MEGFQNSKWKKINTPWGKPSDEILTAKLGKEEFALFLDIPEVIKLIQLILILELILMQ